MTRYRIAVAGFQHETNTFAPGRAGIEEFRMADSWPALLEGEAVRTVTHGMNLPIAGAIAAAQRHGSCEVIPILWCAAEPCGPVTDRAFDWVFGKILDGVRAAGPIDALYLDLHGAMVTESHPDGEAELLRRLRAELGADFPIGVSLDLHANISARFVALATRVTVFRTYPHLDMADTGARCLEGVIDHLDGRHLHAAFKQAPFLIPLHAQCTDFEPCRTLYNSLQTSAFSGRGYTELALGFPAADVADCGPSVLAYAESEGLAQDRAERLLQDLLSSEPQFDTTLYDADAAVRRAMRNSGTRPIVLADVQDNPGGGGTSDTTGLLRSLIAQGATRAIVGVFCDPALARAATDAGEGATFESAIGGCDGTDGSFPLVARFRVLHLSDGHVPYSGEMYGGGTATLGPSCCLAVESGSCDIKVVVSSVRVQCLDQALFRWFGLDPTKARVIVVKSTVHFRADFDTIAEDTLSVAVPGALTGRLDEARFANLRPNVRLGPMGPLNDPDRG